MSQLGTNALSSYRSRSFSWLVLVNKSLALIGSMWDLIIVQQWGNRLRYDALSSGALKLLML